MNVHCNQSWLAAAALASAIGVASGVAVADNDPVGTTFTYQGRLTEAGEPVSGTVDLVFRLFDVAEGGTPLSPGGVLIADDYELGDDGRFTIDLDFGDHFTGAPRWLEIDVNGVTLSPRLPIMAAPHAMVATTAANVPTKALIGIYSGISGVGTLDSLHVSGNVGLGTPPTPNVKLDVVASGLPIRGVRESTNGTFPGVHGASNSIVGNASGVRGHILNDSPSSTSAGVWGHNFGTTNTGYGVRGTHESGGTGVYGESISGTGVYGFASAPSGPTYGVYGESASASGRAVYGLASATIGTNSGVQGDSHGSSGRGVYGRATADSGSTFGVLGQNFSTGGAGVLGHAIGATGTAAGVHGQTQSNAGYGVYGRAFSLSGTTYGGWFESNSTSGRGVFGIATASSGTTTGVLGRSDSSSGRGIQGFANHTTGTNYAVYGQSLSPNGYGGYFLGRGYFSGRVGLNVLDPDYRLELPNNAMSGIGQARANAWHTYSSIRWKENVRPIEDALGMLMRLNGVVFDWKEEHGGGRDIGFVAEHVGAVVPQIVSWEEDGEHAQGMAYDRITALAVEAIKEQQHRIESLSAENADLCDRLATLERIVADLIAQPKGVVR